MVITVTDGMATLTPDAQDLSTEPFIGAISFLCVALCVAVVMGGAVAAAMLAKSRMRKRPVIDVLRMVCAHS